ncbi:hypothetical protein GGI12_004755 [Dipsacomyces acuminosporus]|nr:hypothetical protein GGI12_004755 [Dipsacomyces acuminosporus]
MATKAFAALAVLFATAATSSANPVAAGHSGLELSTREANINDMYIYKGGMLFIDGRQTSCQLAIIDNRAAFVAANCLKYKSDGTVDTSPKYEAYINGAFDGAPSHYSINKVTAHPKYDPKTFANNIAVLEYNKGAEIAWVSPFVLDRSKWENIVYGRYKVDTKDSNVENKPTLVPNPLNDALCSQSSPIYSANTKDMLCSNVAMASAADTSCKVPYGIAYGVNNYTLYQIGIYSHTAVYGGDGLCKFSNQRSYYTMIGDYMAFQDSVLNHAKEYDAVDKIKMPQNDPGYAMQPPSGSVPSDVKYIGGDIYASQSPSPQSSATTTSSASGSASNSDSSTPTGTNKPTGSASSPPNSPTTSTSTSSSGGASNINSQGSGSGGSSQKTITTILGVCISLGVIILMICILALVWYLKKKRRILGWSARSKDGDNLRTLANEIGGARYSAQNYSANANRYTTDFIMEASPNDGLPAYTSIIAIPPINVLPPSPTQPINMDEKKS